jgi:hypothetical protein
MACRQAMAPYGLEPRSLVYPYNHMGHQFLDLLHQLGITVVRHRDPRVRLAYPQRSEAGVYLIYESMNLRRPRWYRYADKAAIHLRRARETRSSYHLWFHPSDPLSVVQTELASILRLAASLRDQGALWTASMKDLASYCEAREQAKLSVRWESNQAVIGLKVERDACLSDAGLLTLLVEKRAGTPRAWSISSGCTPQETPMTETLVGRGREGFRLNVPVTATTVTIRWS